jgi:hypothetical protein
MRIASHLTSSLLRNDYCSQLTSIRAVRVPIKDRGVIGPAACCMGFALIETLLRLQYRPSGFRCDVVFDLIRGTQMGLWRGLPATGWNVEVPLCGVYTFDEDDRLAGERIYYDRATVLTQLGVLHDRQSLLGRIVTLAKSSDHICASSSAPRLSCLKQVLCKEAAIWGCALKNKRCIRSCRGKSD